MSQNQSIADQLGVIIGLKEAGDAPSLAVAEIMEQQIAGG